MITDEIKTALIRLQDPAYRDFQSKLIPTIPAERFIGVRTPELRKLAKQYARRNDADVFLRSLPHPTFDEGQLHAFIVSEIKNFGECLQAVDVFLPCIDNWATCDQMSPKVFGEHKQELLPAIDRWIASGRTYTIRFGIKMLMEHFLDEDFDPVYPEKVSAVRSDEYYVRMMAAWYFATALAKQYETILPFLEEHRLDPWTHNKTIQKACESYRIQPDRKDYLRGIRIKGGTDHA